MSLFSEIEVENQLVIRYKECLAKAFKDEKFTHLDHMMMLTAAACFEMQKGENKKDICLKFF